MCAEIHSRQGSRRYGADVDSAKRFGELINSATSAGHLDYLCALMCAAIDPSCDVGQVLKSLDDCAADMPTTFEGVIGSLFGSGLFSGDVDQYHAVENSLLHKVMERRIGMPITLSVVAIEVGRRQGVPILGIGLPGHFVVRDADSDLYADPFGGGVIYDRAGLTAAWKLRGMGDVLNPVSLIPMGARKIVLRILNNLRASLISAVDTDPFDTEALDQWPDQRIHGLVRLRSLVPEFDDEAAERLRWVRYWN